MKNSILAIFLLIACTYAVDLSEKCARDNSCTAANAECKRTTETTCIYGTCSCKTGYSPAGTDDKECFQQSDFGGSCNATEKRVCNPNKHLNCNATQQCECAEGFEETSNECKPTPVNYDGDCFDTLQCTGGGLTNAICTGGPPKKCICAPGFYRGTNECVPKLEFDATCTSGDDNCNDLKNLKCDNDKCVCAETHIEKSKVCVLPLKGDSCPASQDCGLYMDCKGTPTTCDCKADYSEKTFNEGGVQVKKCIHNDAKIDVGADDKCIEMNDNTGRFCVANLLCDLCHPGSTNRICLAKLVSTTSLPSTTPKKDGATTVSASFSSVAISLISVVVVALRV